MSLFLLIQAIVCGLIALRVFLFQRRGKRYRPAIAFLAYLMVVTSAAVTICIGFGLCKEAYLGTLALLVEFLCALCIAYGNIAKLYQKKSSSMQYKPCQLSHALVRKNKNVKRHLQQAQ